MVSNDNKYIVNQGILGDVDVRKTVDGKILSNYKAVTSALSPKHNLLALGLENGMIKVVNLDNFQTVSRMVGHKKKILAMAFSPDEKFLVSSGQDCQINAWNINSGTKLHDFENTSISPYADLQDVKSRVFIYSLNFIDDTGFILGYGSWGTAINWTGKSGKLNYFVQKRDVESFPEMDSIKPHSNKIIAIDINNEKFNIFNQYYDLKSGEESGSDNSVQSNYQESSDISCDKFGIVSKNNVLKFSLGENDQHYYICTWDVLSKTIKSVTGFFPNINNSKSQPGDPVISKDDSLLFVPTSDGVTFVFKVPE
jgi:WD40 repeat protein